MKKAQELECKVDIKKCQSECKLELECHKGQKKINLKAQTNYSNSEKRRNNNRFHKRCSKPSLKSIF